MNIGKTVAQLRSIIGASKCWLNAWSPICPPKATELVPSLHRQHSLLLPWQPALGAEEVPGAVSLERREQTRRKDSWAMRWQLAMRLFGF